MGDPILRLAVRSTRRTSTTAWGIAFACMVLVGSISLVEGLRSGVDAVAGRLTPDLHVYASEDDLLASRIDQSMLAASPLTFVAVRVHVAVLEVNGLPFDVVVGSMSNHTAGDPGGTTGWPVGSDHVAVDVGLRGRIERASGAAMGPSGNLTLFGIELPLPLVMPPPARPAFLPDTWAWVRPELLVAMNPTEGGPIQAIVTTEPVDPSVLGSLGLRRVDAIGAIGFVRSTVDEASRALTALAAVIAGVVGLLVYYGMSLEVHQRTEEIRVLRGLGASPRTVAAIYEGKALAVAAFGATMGSALGILAAHAIVSFAPLVGLPNLVILAPPLGAVALASGLSLSAAGLAGLVPARRAARTSRRAREVGRSS